MNSTEVKITNTIEIIEEIQEDKFLQEAKEQLVLITDILERPEMKRILNNIHIAIPFLSDIDNKNITDKINKLRTFSAHTTMCASNHNDDFSFLINLTKSLKDMICKIFDDLIFFIQFTRGTYETEWNNDEREREEQRYIEIIHIVANAYREMTNLPIIEIPKRFIAHQGAKKKT